MFVMPHLWDDAVHTTNAIATVRPVPNRADRRKAARAGGKPSKGTKKDKRIKKNKK